MARIRTIKPEFYTDGDMLRLSITARLFYIGLWNFADDNGVLDYDLVSLKAKVFPNDRINIEKLLQELQNIRKILIYEVKNKQYIFVKNLTAHQHIDRQRKSNLPLPDPNHLKSLEITPVSKEVSKVSKGREGRKINEIIPTFFSYYLLKTKKAFKLTPDKEELIRQRFKDGYTLEQLKQAVDNFVADDWDGRKDHLDLIYCIGKQKGKPDNLEKWLNKKKDSFSEFKKHKEN